MSRELFGIRIQQEVWLLSLALFYFLGFSPRENYLSSFIYSSPTITFLCVEASFLYFFTFQLNLFCFCSLIENCAVISWWLIEGFMQLLHFTWVMHLVRLKLTHVFFCHYSPGWSESLSLLHPTAAAQSRLSGNLHPGWSPEVSDVGICADESGWAQTHYLNNIWKFGSCTTHFLSCSDRKSPSKLLSVP